MVSGDMAMWIDIAGRRVSREDPVYVVAEMACAHQGDIGKALALVDAASAAGVDAVQFEMFSAPDNMVPVAPIYPTLQKLQLSVAQWRELFVAARSKGLATIGYVYDPPSLEWALSASPDALKLNASDLCNPELVRAVASADLPFTLGTGAATSDEIAEALEVVRSTGNRRLILMHGVQNFPTALADARIRRIAWLEQQFGCLVGYADHTDARMAVSRITDIAAIGAGAVLVEKHFILDREKDEIDAVCSLQPAELLDYVSALRDIASALTPYAPGALTPSDEKYRRFQRKVVVAAQDLPRGTVLDRNHVSFLRHPEGGLAPAQVELIYGRKTRGDVAAFSPISIAQLEP